VRDVKLYNQSSDKLIAALDRAVLVVEIPNPFALNLHRQVIFKRLDLTNLQVALNVDQQGVTNFDGLHSAPPSAPSRITFDFSSLVGSIDGGTIQVDDRVHKVKAELSNIQGNARPMSVTSLAKVKLTAGAGLIAYEVRETKIDSFEFAGQVGETGLNIEQFAIDSPAMQVSATGKIDSEPDLTCDIGVQGRLSLADVTRILAPDTKAQGTAAFDGKIEAKRSAFKITGNLRSEEVLAMGARVRGGKLNDIDIHSDGGSISFSMRNASANSAIVEGAEVTRIIAAGLRGNIRDGKAQASLQHLAIADLTVPDVRVSSVSVEGASAALDNQRYQATGSLRIQGGNLRGTELGVTQGKLRVSNGLVALDQFSAAVLGGNTSGDIVVQTSGGGLSHLKATFSGFNTTEINKVAAGPGSEPPPLAGLVTGEADVGWPGTRFSDLTGKLVAHFTGQTTEASGSIPVNGDVDVTARDGSFDLNQFVLATSASRVEAGGRVSPDDKFDVRLSLTSTDASELQRIAYSIDDIKNSLADYQPRLAGQFSFRGGLTGSLSDPAIQGDLIASDIGLHDKAIGSLTGRFALSPDEVAFQNGVLTVASGGSAKFSYAAPRSAAATDGRLDATIDRVNVDTLIAAAGVSTQTAISGLVSGQAHLTGLPGSPTGTAIVSVSGGEVAGQHSDSASANLVFDGRTARLEQAVIHTANGQLTASGALDLKSDEFQLNGRADNIDLGELAASLNSTVSVSGMANATFQTNGNTKEIGQLKIGLSAQGSNVAMNDRPIGELRLTASTNEQGRVDVNLVTGISGPPQTIRGTIELRSHGKPITVESDLADFDLSPIVAILGASATSFEGKVNGRLRLAGPIEDAQGDLSMDGLHGDLRLTAISLQVQGRKVNITTPFTVSMNGPQVAISQTRITSDGLDLSVGGTIGLRDAGRMAFTVAGTTDLDTFGQLGPDINLGGKVAINATLEGTFGDPHLAGEIRMTGLSFSSGDTPVAIAEGNGRLVLAGDTIHLENFTAKANDGTVSTSGEITLNKLKPESWRFTITAADVDMFYQGVQALIKGTLTLTGSPDGQLLSGTLTVPEADYTSNLDIQSLMAGGSSGFTFGGGGSGGGTFGLPQLNLDIHVSAPGTMLIRNQQVNTVATASLNIGGDIDDPDVTGRVEIEGGTIKLRSQKYDLTIGTIDFLGGGASPEVNLLAEADISQYHVYVGLAGPIDNMEVTLRSDPDLARSDVLSLVVTGRTGGPSLGAQDVMNSGIGAAGSLLSESFLSQPAQSLLGLNRFQIDPDLRPNQNPAARVTVGKQVTRDLSFTYSTDLSSQQDQSIIAEYTLSNKFSGTASYTQGGNVTNGANTDSDFTIEVRRRSRFSLGYGMEDTATSSAGKPERLANRNLPHAHVDIQQAGLNLSEKTLRQLLPVESQGFSRALALLGERNLANYLQEQGYFFATVRFKCDPSDCSGTSLSLLYEVKAGMRYDLDNIRLEGTDEIKLGDLSGELRSKKASIVGGIPILRGMPLIGGLARGITSNDRIASDRETIKHHLADLGFRSAKVDAHIERGPQSQDAVLVFTVDEGSRSTVTDVGFSGNQILLASELAAVVPINGGKPFSPTLTRQGVQQIKQLYGSHGYLDTQVRYNMTDVAPNQVRLIYNVSEGSRAIVAQIAITGQTKTRQDAIERFLAFKQGETITPDKIRQTQRDLYATGAFSSIDIRNEPIPSADEGARRVTVKVVEAKPLLFVYGAGYSTGQGPLGLLQLTDSNLFGRANSSSFRLRMSQREEFAQWQYTDLKFLGSNWATTVSAFYDRNSNISTFVQVRLSRGGTAPASSGPGYGIERFAAFIQAERKFSKSKSLYFRYNFENSRLFNTQNIPLLAIAPNQQSILLGMFSAGFTYDGRDSALNPNKGQLISFQHSLASSQIGGNVSFNKFFASYQHYWALPRSTPVLRDSVLAVAARVGLAAPFNLGSQNGVPADAVGLLPISERFFAGGATTLRGFRFDEAGPQGILEPRNRKQLPTLVPVGGDAMVVINFEERFPLTRELRLVPFYDLGNVFRRVSDISWGGMTHSVGLGFRINTPIGPVGVDYGYLLNPPSFTSAGGIFLRQPQGVIHIRFGQTF
jgi:outer membrane protein assembly complex protein YaeT